MEPLSATDPRTIGEYALRARLGSGGMGRVYLGFSRGGRAVAIKVVHPELARDPEFLERFGREVASARAVSGVYTAPVVASGLNDDPPWMATAFVPGRPLSDVVSRHGPLPEAAVWRLAAGLAEALHAVHACNLVHRDLKPSNVLLAPDGPRVIDFGISRALEGTALTSAGMVVGTPGYMSPEQAEGHQAGPPSDVFSLGCVLAYAATGAAPFGAGSAASVLYKVVTAEPDLGAVPAKLRQVIEACLHKRASERTVLSHLSAMIAALGPTTPVGLGSFWPEPVASFVAADQAYPTTQVGPPPISPAQSGWTPAASGGQADPASVVAPAYMATQGPTPGATGHAPMVADGYYAAAAGSMIPGGPARTQYSQPSAGQSWPPQYPGGTAGPQYPGGAAGPQYPGGTAGPQYPGGTAGPQQPPATPWPQPAQSTHWSPQPGPVTPLAQYTPGRRRPATSEVPGTVLAAIRLMYLGAVTSVLYVIFGVMSEGRYDRYAALHPFRLAGKQAHTMAGDLAATAVIGGAIGIACWIVLATSCRRGHGWTRIAATILLALHTVGMLTDLHATHGDPAVKVTAIIIWAIGLATVILLWGPQAGRFFLAWRKR